MSLYDIIINLTDWCLFCLLSMVTMPSTARYTSVFATLESHVDVIWSGRTNFSKTYCQNGPGERFQSGELSA